MHLQLIVVLIVILALLLLGVLLCNSRGAPGPQEMSGRLASSRQRRRATAAAAGGKAPLLAPSSSCLLLRPMSSFCTSLAPSLPKPMAAGMRAPSSDTTREQSLVLRRAEWIRTKVAKSTQSII